MTKVSKKKVERFLQKYVEYSDKYNHFKLKGNNPQAEIYSHKMKAMRTTLGLLEIHIDGLNSVRR